jgi:hypothetical protein
MTSPTSEEIRAKFEVLKPLMDERTRRLRAATEARTIGRGGITRVSQATGISPVTIRAGLSQLERLPEPDAMHAIEGRVRRPGGGPAPGPYAQRSTNPAAGVARMEENRLAPRSQAAPTGISRPTPARPGRGLPGHTLGGGSGPASRPATALKTAGRRAMNSWTRGAASPAAPTRRRRPGGGSGEPASPE